MKGPQPSHRSNTIRTPVANTGFYSQTIDTEYNPEDYVKTLKHGTHSIILRFTSNKNPTLSKPRLPYAELKLNLKNTKDMDALTCITSKHETRQFLDKPVDDSTLTRILDAGRLAGSAKNKQPWCFILIKDKARLKELATFGNSTASLANSNFAVVIATPNNYMQDRFDAG